MNSPKSPQSSKDAPTNRQLRQSSLRQNPLMRFFTDPKRPVAIKVASVLLVFFLFNYLFLGKSKNQTPEATTKPEKRSQEISLGHDNNPQVNRQSEPSNTQPVPQKVVSQPSNIINPIFTQIPGLFPFAVSIIQIPKGDIWIATMQDITEFKAGDPAKMSKKLDARSYDDIFNNDLPPITAMHNSQDDELWTGSREGEMMRYANYDWKIIFESNGPIPGQINAISSFEDNLYIGGKGLWKWNKNTAKLTRYPAFKETLVNTFAQLPQKKLLMGTKSGIWVLEDKGWSKFWQSSITDKTINAIVIDGEQSILVGTEDGLVRLSAVGVLIERMLAGNSVTAIAKDRENNLWVGTRSNGIKFSNNKQWYAASINNGFPGEQVTALMIDKEDKLWVGLAAKGIFTASVSETKNWIQKYPDVAKLTDNSAPKLFPSACKAAQSELREKKLSGGIASDMLDGVNLVFFDERLVCPRGQIGFRTQTGTIVLLNNWRVTAYTNGQRKEITVPQNFPADQVKTIFLDSRRRIWMGSDTAGALMYDGTTWISYQDDALLTKNPIQSITEDPKGNIWIASMPPFDNESRKYHLPNLHRIDHALNWTHYSPVEGLGFWSTASLLVLKDGRLAVGTNGGLSIISEKGITNYRDKDGLEQKYVYTLSQDLDGNIWMGHLYWGNGITWYDGSNFHNVKATDGLFSERIASIAHDALGRVWITSSNGATGIYPRAFFEIRASEKIKSTNNEQSPPINKKQKNSNP